MLVRDRGKSTSQKNRMGEAPSILDASASSSGTVKKNCLNKNVAVAEAMRGMVKPAKLLIIPKSATTL